MEKYYIKIDKIKPYEKNQKKHSKTQIENVAKSIKKYGQTQPIVIDNNNVIIVGHCRYLALKKIGVKEVWVEKLSNLTQQQIDEYRILDNKLNESEWDLDLLWEDSETIKLLEDEFDIKFDINEKKSLK